MIQITDKNGNVLIEPYLAMATANFKSEFNSDFEQTHSLGTRLIFVIRRRGLIFGYWLGMAKKLQRKTAQSQPYRPQQPRVWHWKNAWQMI